MGASGGVSCDRPGLTALRSRIAHEYSNSNNAVLGVVLKTVTGRSYGAAPQDLLADDTERPQHMLYRDRPSSTPTANGYDVSVLNLGRRNLTGYRTSCETGGNAAGGVLSNASDVAHFLDTLMAGEPLSAEALEQVHDFAEAPDEDLPKKTGDGGLGPRRLRVSEQDDLVGHTGTIPGYSGIALHNPRHGVAIAVLGNQASIDQAGLFADVQSAVRERPSRSESTNPRRPHRREGQCRVARGPSCRTRM